MRTIPIVLTVALVAYCTYNLAQHPQIPIREKLANAFITQIMFFCGVGGTDPRYIRSVCNGEQTFKPNDGHQDGIKIDIISTPLLYGNVSKNIVVRHLLSVKQSSEKLPLLIYLHGGGYVLGSADIQDGLLKSIINHGKITGFIKEVV